MRRTLGTLIVLATLVITAACGNTSSSSVATDPSQGPSQGPASDPAGKPSWPPGTISDATVLPLISMTAAGGREARVATPLNTEAQIARFASQFRMPAVWHRIRAAIGDELKASDHEIVGQVVAVGCDRPPGVDVIANDEGQVELVPREVASPLEECLAAVTTVAIAVLPSN
jgi:hypothetical protein